MLEYTVTTNRIWDFQVPYALRIAQRYPGARMAIFDVHSLMTDIYNNPTACLNGTDGTANVTAQYFLCVPDVVECTTKNGSIDGYMWFDELHPSERMDQIIAEEFIRVVEGRSSYAAYW